MSSDKQRQLTKEQIGSIFQKYGHFNQEMLKLFQSVDEDIFQRLISEEELIIDNSSIKRELTERQANFKFSSIPYDHSMLDLFNTMNETTFQQCLEAGKENRIREHHEQLFEENMKQKRLEANGRQRVLSNDDIAILFKKLGYFDYELMKIFESINEQTFQKFIVGIENKYKPNEKRISKGKAEGVDVEEKENEQVLAKTPSRKSNSRKKQQEEDDKQEDVEAPPV
jgi:hypothetical protein